MRRLRPDEPGGVVVIDAMQEDRGSISIVVPEQVAVDTDIRKVLVKIRDAMAVKLRGSAQPPLAKTYSLTDVVGGPDRATTTIEMRANDADKYLDRRFSEVEAEVVDAMVAEWLELAAPSSGDGVGTEPTVNTAGQRPMRIG